jgi:hypothetical protein
MLGVPVELIDNSWIAGLRGDIFAVADESAPAA